MRRQAFVLGATLVLAACGGHAAMRGSVVMKVNDTQAHVCMGDKEVAMGDRVDLVRHECATSGGSARSGVSSDRCKRVVVGQGQVTQVLNEHYSIVDFPAGVPFKEGDSIEKVK